MDYQQDFAKKIILTLWIFVFTLVITYILLRRHWRLKLPPGPWGLPIVGYLPFLSNEPHRDLHRLSKKYGDIFGLYLGTTYVVVVSDCALARELLSLPSTADRPPGIFQHLPDGAGVGDLNGPAWVQQRRYTVQKMKNLGLGSSEWEKMVQAEVKAFVDWIDTSNGKPLNIIKPLSATVSNNVMSLVSGNNLPVGDPKRDVIDYGIESFELLSVQTGIISYFPKLFKMGVNLGLIKVKEKLKAVQGMNKLVKQYVEEFKHNKDSHSFIYDYLMEIEKNKALDPNSSFNETNLVGNVQVLIMAGSDTTKVSLMWLFLAMAAFPDIQDKVHAEIDSFLGRDGEPSGWMDRQKLPYCHATIMEGQRWRTVVPLNVLHRTNSDTTIRDFVIPKGSDVIALIWAFHNDEKHWTDPNEFQPERFLDQNGKVLKKVENYSPFAFGKRSCIGETVANIELFLYFVGVMQKFRILPASDTTPLDLEGNMGLTFQPPAQNLRYLPR